MASPSIENENSELGGIPSKTQKGSYRDLLSD